MKLNPDREKSPETLAWEKGYAQGFANAKAMTPTHTPAPQDERAAWKVGNEFAPFHPGASHVDPAYRDGWNACYRAALAAGGGEPAPAIPPGYVPVPVELTPEMRRTLVAMDPEHPETGWAALIAAPQQEKPNAD